MKAAVEDLKETTPCGMTIHYTVDTATDFVTYTDINGRGKYRLCEACERCSWKGICKPTECNYISTIQETLGKAVEPLDVITQIFEQAAAGYQSETLYADGLVKMRVTKEPYRRVAYEADPLDDDGDLMD